SAWRPPSGARRNGRTRTSAPGSRSVPSFRPDRGARWQEAALSGSPSFGEERIVSGLFVSIRHNLAGLLRFSGRDARRTFWPYAILLFLLSTAAYMVLGLFIAADMFAK